MNDDQLLRYSRQIMLDDIEVEGQQKLLKASVLVVGLGGLGAPAAMYLVASGVGRVVLVDDDSVEISNLQRQIIHNESGLGTPKVESAANTLSQLNRDVIVETECRRLDGQDLHDAVSSVDVVIDATDNFRSRYAINDASLATSTPLVSGAAIRFEGQVAVFDPTNPDSPCYRCLYSDGGDEQLNCAENGVASPLVGIIGSVQAMEAIKVIAGFGETLVGYVLYLDAKRMEWRRFKLPRDPECQSCKSYH